MANRLTILIDWDGTLVDKHGEWQPGAQDALRALLTRGHTIAVHSARASHERGRQQIEAKLGPLTGRIAIYPKPEADLYVDDRAHHHRDWSDTLTTVRLMARRRT